MNTFISIKSIALRKLLNRYKFPLKGKQEIIKGIRKSSSTWSGLKILVRKFELKEIYKKKYQLQ